eukprot:scaffold89539_cov17-Tisochrysis_lutea.AAC.1
MQHSLFPLLARERVRPLALCDGLLPDLATVNQSFPYTVWQVGGYSTQDGGAADEVAGCRELIK